MVLTCGEHEDDAQFKKEVLADQELVRVLKEKDVLVWAADSRIREGYQGESPRISSVYNKRVGDVTTPDRLLTS